MPANSNWPIRTGEVSIGDAKDVKTTKQLTGLAREAYATGTNTQKEFVAPAPAKGKLGAQGKNG